MAGIGVANRRLSSVEDETWRTGRFEVHIPQHNFTVSPIELASRNAMSEHLGEALEKLNEREALVIRLRNGLIDDRERTLEEVGQQLGVTRERIRQIENNALPKLRYFERRNRGLRDFVSS